MDTIRLDTSMTRGSRGIERISYASSSRAATASQITRTRRHRHRRHLRRRCHRHRLPCRRRRRRRRRHRRSRRRCRRPPRRRPRGRLHCRRRRHRHRLRCHYRHRHRHRRKLWRLAGWAALRSPCSLSSSCSSTALSALARTRSARLAFDSACLRASETRRTVGCCGRASARAILARRTSRSDELRALVLLENYSRHKTRKGTDRTTRLGRHTSRYAALSRSPLAINCWRCGTPHIVHSPY